jgi:cystathionine gamma-lyase
LIISRCVVPPIVTSTNYEKDGPDDPTGYQYTRYKNPTRDVLEQCLASLDNAKFALSYSAGVGALTGIISTLQSGDEIISTRDLYGGTLRIFRDFATKMGITLTYVNFDDLKSLERAFKPNTKIVWIESPTNPLMTVLDIQAIADVVHAKSQAYLVVDNTFLTSYFQRPLELGADVAMYSLSKFESGHSDVVMGSIATNNEKLYESFKYFQLSLGLTPPPFDCYLVNRSLKTLSLRMEKHSENAFAVAVFLDSHPKVDKVFHPFLKSHKKHQIALKQSSGHSGILSFYLAGTLEQSENFFNSLNLILVAQSLGGVETTASFPWSMSHADVSEEQRLEVGVTQSLIRLSVGLEDVSQIIGDLKHALANM